MDNEGAAVLPCVEESPAPYEGRFGRYATLLGEGSVKRVYRALDRNHGKQVAWNEIDISHVPEEARPRLFYEVELLRRVEHPNIIHFYGSWASPEKVVFITEVVEGGDLTRFYSTHSVKLRVVKKWCRQILSALRYLHSFSPPIIHRDIKCENMLYSAAEGTVKVGDLGLSHSAPGGSARGGPPRSSDGGDSGGAAAAGAGAALCGTPAYMAPEMYDGVVHAGVDIYAFGMALLEIASRAPPYSECTNPAQIFLKVVQGEPPAALARIAVPSLSEFIRFCISPVDGGGGDGGGGGGGAPRRPAAADALAHPFLRVDEAHAAPEDEETALAEEGSGGGEGGKDGIAADRGGSEAGDRGGGGGGGLADGGDAGGGEGGGSLAFVGEGGSPPAGASSDSDGDEEELTGWERPPAEGGGSGGALLLLHGSGGDAHASPLNFQGSEAEAASAAAHAARTLSAAGLVAAETGGSVAAAAAALLAAASLADASARALSGAARVAAASGSGSLPSGPSLGSSLSDEGGLLVVSGGEGSVARGSSSLEGGASESEFVAGDSRPATLGASGDMGHYALFVGVDGGGGGGGGGDGGGAKFYGGRMRGDEEDRGVSSGGEEEEEEEGGGGASGSDASSAAVRTGDGGTRGSRGRLRPRAAVGGTPGSPLRRGGRSVGGGGGAATATTATVPIAGSYHYTSSPPPGEMLSGGAGFTPPSHHMGGLLISRSGGDREGADGELGVGSIEEWFTNGEGVGYAGDGRGGRRSSSPPLPFEGGGRRGSSPPPSGETPPPPAPPPPPNTNEPESGSPLQGVGEGGQLAGAGAGGDAGGLAPPFGPRGAGAGGSGAPAALLSPPPNSRNLLLAGQTPGPGFAGVFTPSSVAESSGGSAFERGGGSPHSTSGGSGAAHAGALSPEASGGGGGGGGGSVAAGEGASPFSDTSTGMLSAGLGALLSPPGGVQGSGEGLGVLFSPPLAGAVLPPSPGGDSESGAGAPPHAPTSPLDGGGAQRIRGADEVGSPGGGGGSDSGAGGAEGGGGDSVSGPATPMLPSGAIHLRYAGDDRILGLRDDAVAAMRPADLAASLFADREGILYALQALQEGTGVSAGSGWEARVAAMQPVLAHMLEALRSPHGEAQMKLVLHFSLGAQPVEMELRQWRGGKWKE